MAWVRGMIVDERAHDLIEYGLPSAPISVAVIAAVSVLALTLRTTYGSFDTQIRGFSSGS
jgi:Flp pilus assembly pilin Flp